MGGHWPGVQESALFRRRAPLEMRNDQTYSFRDEIREEGPLRRRATREVAHPPGTILPRLTLTEHRDFETLTIVVLLLLRSIYYVL